MHCFFLICTSFINSNRGRPGNPMIRLLISFAFIRTLRNFPRLVPNDQGNFRSSFGWSWSWNVIKRLTSIDHFLCFQTKITVKMEIEGNIIKQLWAFQLLYMMLICTKQFYFGAYHIMYNSWKVHNCIIFTKYKIPNDLRIFEQKPLRKQILTLSLI